MLTSSNVFNFLNFVTVPNAFVIVILVCFHLRQQLKLFFQILTWAEMFFSEFCYNWLLSSTWFLKANFQEMSHGKFEFKICLVEISREVFIIMMWLKVFILKISFLNNFFKSNFSFGQNFQIYVHISVADSWWMALLTNN